MTNIKSITFLMKCLKVDIPIYKEVSSITVRVPRVVLYRTSLIELISLVSASELHILLSKEHADAIIKAIAEAEKERQEFASARTKAVPALVTPKTTEVKAVITSEPGYELVVDTEGNGDVSQQVGAI